MSDWNTEVGSLLGDLYVCVFIIILLRGGPKIIHYQSIKIRFVGVTGSRYKGGI